MGKKAYPSRYPAPEVPKTVKAEKLVAAIVPSRTTVPNLRLARKYVSGDDFQRVRAISPIHRTIRK